MRGAVQTQITTIGLDIAKNVFQVHGIDANETVVVRKQLRRGQVMKFFETLPPCLVGMEACATAHYWARELTKLGHEVRLMPAKAVKAYVKRNKNDAADAEAICEAVRRPMRFVGVKSAEQQGRLIQHRARDLLLRQRTQVIKPCGSDDGDERLPTDARASLIVLAAQLQALQTLIGSIEKRIIAQHRASELQPSRDRRPGRERHHCHGHGPQRIPVGTRFCSLDRAGAPTRFNRRQTEAWADFQAGRPLPAAPSRGRCACRITARAPSRARACPSDVNDPHAT